MSGKTIIFILIFIVEKSFCFNQHNILFIMLDDLRPTINSLGDKNAYTPNIDKLIEKSFVFENAFAQQALCAPSRNSMLTSRRPDTLHLYDFYSYWRTFIGNFTTLPQYLKENGYYTYSIGKIFHPGMSSNFTDDYPYSWTSSTFHPSTEKYTNRPVCHNSKNTTNNNKLYKNLLCPVNLEYQPENTLPDIQSMLKCKEMLTEFKQKNKKFFLAVGFHKPHIPFKFPRKYLNFHPIDNFYKPSFDNRPYGMPLVSWNPYTDLRSRDDVKLINISFPFGPVPSLFGYKIRQHYYASVTYIDDLIGELLKSVNLNDTIIILTSDHGWSLGEHAEWAKYSNFDVALKVPLVIYLPQNKEKQIIKKPIELVDIFPTIVDLTNLPALRTCNEKNLQTCTEGKSLFPLMMGKQSQDNFIAYSQYPRPCDYPKFRPNSDKPKLYQIRIMGYTLRTIQYRYTLWIRFNSKTFKKNWNKIYGEELYDHSIDPDENINVCDRKELNSIRLALKMKLLQKFSNISYKF